MKIKVAVLQYEVPMETDASFKKLNEMVSQACWSGAKLVVAPETAVGNADELDEKETDYFQKVVNIAKNNKVYLASSYYTKIKGKVYNHGLVFSPSGELVLSHDKIYPAKPEVENIGVVGGNRLEIGNTKIGKLGMIICKDGFNKYSHFLYEKLGELAAEIICIPTWSIGWKKVLGVSNEEYVKAFIVYGSFLSRSYVLMSGNLNKNFDSFGRSLIVSPVRGVLKEGSRDRKEILFEELDLSEVQKARDFDSWWQPKDKVTIK